MAGASLHDLVGLETRVYKHAFRLGDANHTA